MNERELSNWKSGISKERELNLSSALTKIIFVFALFAIGTPPHYHFEIVFMSPSHSAPFYLLTFLSHSLSLLLLWRSVSPFYLNDMYLWASLSSHSCCIFLSYSHCTRVLLYFQCVMKNIRETIVIKRKDETEKKSNFVLCSSSPSC